MAKRKRAKTTPKSKSNENKFLNYIVWGLAIFALIISGLIAGYYFGVSNTQEEIEKQSKIEIKKRLVISERLESIMATHAKEKESVEKRLQELLSKRDKEFTSPSHELDTKEKKPPANVKRKIKYLPSRPKLAIIIDDVSTKYHVKAIKSLHIPLTMSFLPPSRARPNSAKLAAKEKFYMVHLPMEAQNFNAEEPLTLRVKDSEETINKRIKELKRLFPRVKYINNHTGSKFTSDERAMNRLIYSLNENKINFIDSRTTAKTKAPIVMKNFGLNYIARDIFLDHKHEKKYVKGQIQRAINIAKKHGYAIAIGHPHKNTLSALAESKKLLSGVELVYINKIP